MEAAGAAVVVLVGLLFGDPGAAAAQGLLFPAPPIIDPAGSGRDRALGDVRLVWRDHPSLRVGRALRLDFGLKLQEDARRPGDDPSGFQTFELHRLRPGIDGELFGRLQFSVERELTENETGNPAEIIGRRKSVWKDYYLDFNLSDGLQVRAGRFKIPFGLEELTSIGNLDFAYRTIDASFLAPARDRGVMLHGRFFDRGLNYWAGGFEHDGDNARSSKIRGGDETVAARVTGTPFRNIRFGARDLEIGGAFTSTAVSDVSILPNGLRGRTVMSDYTFFDPVYVKGRRTRLEADLDWTTGPFNARAEYTWVSDERHDQGLRNEDLPDAIARAWFVSGTWVVTGEKKQRPLLPRRPLLAGGAGAVEIAGRFEQIRFGGLIGDDEPFRNPRAVAILPVTNKIVTVGINWYLNRWLKLQANTIRQQIDDVERSPVPDGAAFWSQIARLQIVL